MPKKKKTTKRKANLKLCDKLWSKLIKIRAGFKCEYCGGPGENSHHLFTRNNYSTRFDLDNGVCLCKGHHTMSSKFSAHKTPMIFDERIIKKRGQERFDRLKRKTKKVRDKDYDKVEKYLVEETKKLIG